MTPSSRYNSQTHAHPIALAPHTLVLASASPRRLELLTRAGYQPLVRQPMMDDAGLELGNVSMIQRVAALAWYKARLTDTRDIERPLILASDTLLCHDGVAIGKPTHVQQARDVIYRLRGKKHHAFTAVALYDPHTERRMIFADQALVCFHAEDASLIENWLSQGLWIGKAGGYNLDELEHDWGFAIDGDPNVVIGLPMDRLANALLSWTQHGSIT